MSNGERTTLGPLMSLVCFQYLRIGTEEVTARAPIVAAGRKRGTELIQQLGLAGATVDAAKIHAELAQALGVDGTRLCIVQSVNVLPSGGYEVHITEGACTANQTSDEPHCAFTLGVFIGAISTIIGKLCSGHETQCIACGANECIYIIEPI